ncbi:MAG: Holliday junction branch migration protein RuvA [Bacteroidia bacterium]
MITQLEGNIAEKTPTYVVIDCMGVGYQVHISLNTFSKIPAGGKCKLYTLLIIREDAHLLYGFADKHERHLFELLTSVSGVGASTARMILSSLNPSELEQVIASGNVATLKSIKGIGEKSAQRIIVDLKDKISKEVVHADAVLPFLNPIRDEALAALLALGFQKQVAEKALDKTIKSSAATTVEDLIKLSLKNL